MKNSEKLKIILRITWLTQEKLAFELWISFVTLNSLVNEKSNPRKKLEEKINILYLELTAQNIIPDTEIQAKKDIILEKSNRYTNILDFIIGRKDIYDQFLVSLTYNTNSIEGSTLTQNETELILFHNKVIKNKTLVEQLEAKNHQTALVFLFDYLLDKKNIIDEKLVLKLHSILMNSIREDAWLYRNHWVRILWSDVITANYLKVPVLMKELSSEFEENNYDVIKKVSIIHAKFEKIHPFSDGNWRIWRLLMHAMLLKNWLPPALIKKEKKYIYYEVLNKAQIKEDYSLLENFICESIFNSFDLIDEI